ncbi:MAG: hypothetical protein VYC74_07835 [Actinomycetota bacterium]|nr:hypothetical protein [Actinomycetota bacterium]
MRHTQEIPPLLIQNYRLLTQCELVVLIHGIRKSAIYGKVEASNQNIE